MLQTSVCPWVGGLWPWPIQYGGPCSPRLLIHQTRPPTSIPSNQAPTHTHPEHPGCPPHCQHPPTLQNLQYSSSSPPLKLGSTGLFQTRLGILPTLCCPQDPAPPTPSAPVPPPPPVSASPQRSQTPLHGGALGLWLGPSPPSPLDSQAWLRSCPLPTDQCSGAWEVSVPAGGGYS